MNDLFFVEDIGLSIQYLDGDIYIEDLYQYARTFILPNPNPNPKIKVTIVDTREATPKFKYQELLTYLAWLQEEEETDLMVHYLYLVTNPKNTALSLVAKTFYEETGLNSVFSTLKEPLNMLVLKGPTTR